MIFFKKAIIFLHNFVAFLFIFVAKNKPDTIPI